MILEELKDLTHLKDEYVEGDQILISYELFMRITFILGEMKDDFQKYLFTFEKLSRACLLLIRQELKETQIKRENNLSYLQRIWEWGYSKGENSSLFSNSHTILNTMDEVIKTVRSKSPQGDKVELLKVLSNFLQLGNRNLERINKVQLLENLNSIN